MLRNPLLFVLLAALCIAGCTDSEPPPAAPPKPTPTPDPTPVVVRCTPAPGVLCPIDEGPKDAEFERFRTQLREAVRQRNVTMLLPLVDENIRTSFGGTGGHEDLRSRLNDELWAELAQIVDLGGTFREGMFWTPYVYSAWPESVDAFQHVAAIRNGVAIRAEPSASAPVVATVDWAILELTGTANPSGWLHVRQGWVARADVRSPVGYRAGFLKRDGAWRMNALVAGD
jgi:hypothetical protein